jgi:hypothetical protein
MLALISIVLKGVLASILFFERSVKMISAIPLSCIAFLLLCWSNFAGIPKKPSFVALLTGYETLNNG